MSRWNCPNCGGKGWYYIDDYTGGNGLVYCDHDDDDDDDDDSSSSDVDTDD